MMKKSLCLLLSLLLLAIPLAGCSEGGETNTDASTSDASNAADASPGETEAPEETGESFDPGLPEKDFDGRTFTFFTKANSSWSDWAESSIWTEGMTGEVLNDAVFERNDFISDQYNVLFAEYAPSSGSFTSEAEAAVTAGDTTYDVLMPPLNLAGGLLKKGYLVKLDDVEYLDMTKAWWDARSVDDLSIAHQHYMLSGDLSTLNNDATWCTMINLQLIDDFGLEKPYTFVKNDTWTFDTYKSLCETASVDLDGDGDYDSDDSIANLTQNENATAMLVTFGYHLIDKDENDLPVFTLGSNERVDSILRDVSDFMLDKRLSLNYHQYGNLGYHLLTTKMFQENHGLFWITNLQMVIRLREMETDFGIAPCPKYDEQQKNYQNVVWFVGSYASIPISAGNVDESGFLLEALSAKSREILRPAYYEVALSMKYLRDQESVEMLDLIIGNRAYELEHAFSFGASSAVEGIVLNGTDPASTFAKQEKMINKMIEKAVANLTAEP
jgi:hypothetical protein